MKTKNREIIRELGTFAPLWDIVRRQLGDDTKTILWFQVDNPHLGGLAPLSMVRMGRGAKLERIVDDLIAGVMP